MEPPTELRSRPGRKISSCLECQRRKQRCNRQWPCNNCQRRMAGHLCQFGSSQPSESVGQRSSKKRTTESITQPTMEAGGDTSGSDFHIRQQQILFDSKHAVKALGYSEEAKLFMSLDSTNDIPRPVASDQTIEVPDFIGNALHAVPPKPYTDSLVQNFFENVNYHYGAMHQPSFMVSYVDWWVQRRTRHRSLDMDMIVFTCLVLRICASSAQFLKADLVERLEAELCESVESLSSRYQTAAQILSDFVPPGEGGLFQVQQLFLSATWQKAEAEFAKSWHALAAAVRAAQEISMHVKDSSPTELHLDKELRTRIWCALFVWDCFMAAIFHRPTIFPNGSMVQLPNARLDQGSGSIDDIPSPIVEKILQAELAKDLSRPITNDTAARLLSVEKWISSLPPVFSICNPDTRWDLAHPRLVFQRLHLHMAGYMTLVILLRPFLLHSPDDESQSRQAFRIEVSDEAAETKRGHPVAYAVDTALRLMSTCKAFFDLCYPSKSKYFMVSFCPFDTAALLCSALSRNQDHAVVSRRREILQAVGCAQHISRRLCGLTKMGDVTLGILTALVSRLEISAEERNILDIASRSGEMETVGVGKSNNAPGGYPEMSNPEQSEPTWNTVIGADTSESVVMHNPDIHVQEIEDADWDSTLQMNTGNMGLELGILDGIWDWEALGLDTS